MSSKPGLSDAEPLNGHSSTHATTHSLTKPHEDSRSLLFRRTPGIPGHNSIKGNDQTKGCEWQNLWTDTNGSPPGCVRLRWVAADACVPLLECALGWSYYGTMCGLVPVAIFLFRAIPLYDIIGSACIVLYWIV